MKKKNPLTDSWQYGSFVRSVAVRGAEIIPDPVTDEKHAQTLSAFTKRAYGAADSRFYPLWCPAARSAASHAQRSRSFEYSTRSFWPQTQACVILWGTQCFLLSIWATVFQAIMTLCVSNKQLNKSTYLRALVKKLILYSYNIYRCKTWSNFSLRCPCYSVIIHLSAE